MLNFDGPEYETLSNNSQTALLNHTEVSKKIQQELDSGRIAGPFDKPPLPNFKSSPLSLRAKKDPGKFRLLHNLSFPYDKSAVNYYIPKSAATVKYASLQDAILDIQQCSPGAWMAKADIANAFRLIPLHPSQYHLTGFSWNGKYYYDKCLPMGCSSSCSIFESVSDAILWILTEKGGCTRVTKVLDDFLFVAQNKDICSKMLHMFIKFCNILCIPLAEDKTVHPTQIITFLGIELDSIKMEARLPPEKLFSYSEEIKEALQMNKIKLRALKSLIGKLQYATSVVTGGRAFLRRMHNLTIGIQKPHFYIRITEQVFEDLQTWQSFLNNFNGKSFIRELHTATSQTLHFYSDASKQGFGGTYGNHWIQGEWPADWRLYNITILELYPIFLLIQVFRAKLTNSRIIFHCDNKAIVEIINKQTSKCARTMKIIRPMVLALLHNNINFQATHIPGKDNIVCDALSHMLVSPQWMAQQGFMHSPTPIPDAWMPVNFGPL